MTKTEFINTVMENGYSAEEHTVVKYGKEYKAVTVSKEGTQLAPTFYMEHIAELDEFDVMSAVEEAFKDAEGVNVDDFINYEYILEHAFVIGYPSNQVNDEYGFRITGIEEIFFVIKFMVEIGEIGSISVTNKMIDALDITDEQLEILIERAKENTESTAKFTSIEEVLRKLMLARMEDSEELPEDLFERIPDSGMYILTTKDNFFGSGLLSCPSVLDNICKELNTAELIIIPSSKHELIVLRKTADMESKALKTMIEQVNENEVSESDYLADFPILYRSKDSKLLIFH